MRIGRAVGRVVAALAAGGLVAGTAAAQPDPAGAAELHGAQVSVARDPSAAVCPDQDAILDRVRRHLAEGAGDAGGPLAVTAKIRAEAAEFVAHIVVSGQREGQRVLRATGPGCEELADALAVSLALILDGTMTQSLEPLAPTTPQPVDDPPVPELEAPAPLPAALPPPLPVVLLPPPEIPPSASSQLHGWLATGGAITYGVPTDASGAVTLQLGFQYARWSLIAGAFGAPTQTLDQSPGHVDVRLLGGTVHGCGRVLGTSLGLRGDVCAAAGFGELHGWGRGYRDRAEDVSRPWSALGGAVMARGSIFGPLGWGLSGALLAPLAKEQFSVTVQGVPRIPYASRSVAFFGGLALWVRFL